MDIYIYILCSTDIILYGHNGFLLTYKVYHTTLFWWYTSAQGRRSGVGVAEDGREPRPIRFLENHKSNESVMKKLFESDFWLRNL